VVSLRGCWVALIDKEKILTACIRAAGAIEEGVVGCPPGPDVVDGIPGAGASSSPILQGRADAAPSATPIVDNLTRIPDLGIVGRISSSF
jgi:hypothetical protein